MLKPTAGDTLRHARWAKGLSINDLAKEAKVSPTTIIRLERGEEISRGDRVYALAEVLDIDPAPLFTDAPAPAVNE